MKKRFQKIIAWILVMGMMCGSLWIPQEAAAESYETSVAEGEGDLREQNRITGVVSVENPLYEGIVSQEQTPLYAAPGAAARRSETFTSLAQAGTYVRKQMCARAANISLTYKTSSSVVPVNAIFNEALLYTGAPAEGDYLKWHWSRYDSSWSYDPEGYNGVWTFEISYQIQYHSTAAQEAAVTSRVRAVLNQLNLYGKSDYEKVKGIYDYICQNVVYDYTSAGTEKHTAYAALIKGRAVCQGYASLFYRMARELGVDARVIAGTGVTSAGAESHGWNIVNLGNRYYDLDATWDATMKQSGYPYAYFLKGEPEFGRSHLRYNEYRTAEFMRTYPMSNTDYVPAGSNPHVHKYGKPVFQWSQGGKACIAVFRCTAGDDVRNVPCTVESNQLITLKKKGNVVYTAKAVFFGGVYTAEKSVKVLPDRAVLRSAASVNYKSIRLSWKGQSDVSGYTIARATKKNGKYKVIDAVNGSANSYLDTGLKCGTTYYYKIRAYNEFDNKVYKGSYSKIKSAKPVPGQTSVSGAYNKKGKKIRLSWKKISGTDGYVIYRSDKKKGTYRAVKTITKGKITQWTDTKVKKGKQYYYKVRGYRKVKGQKVQGQLSGVRKVKR